MAYHGRLVVQDGRPVMVWWRKPLGVAKAKQELSYRFYALYDKIVVGMYCNMPIALSGGIRERRE